MGGGDADLNKSRSAPSSPVKSKKSRKKKKEDAAIVLD